MIDESDERGDERSPDLVFPKIFRLQKEERKSGVTMDINKVGRTGYTSWSSQ